MLGLSTLISAREDYLGVFETHGVALTGLNTSGNPTSPLPNEGLKHAEDLFKTIDLASKRLAGLIGHVHAKDTKIFPGAAYRGVLDTDFVPVPAEAENKTPVAVGYWCRSWPQDPAWRFVAFGLGHDTEYWAEFLRVISAADPDMNINIEHEDAAYGNVEGLEISAKNLLAAAQTAGLLVAAGTLVARATSAWVGLGIWAVYFK